MKKIALALSIVAFIANGAERPSQVVPVEIGHEAGTFSGTVSISISGTVDNARAEWKGTIKNASPQKIFRATFCLKAFSPNGDQFRPGGKDCVVTLWGTNWSPGAALEFKGKQSIKLGDDKVPAVIAKYAITAPEIFDHAPNRRTIDAQCSLVWPSSTRVFADRKFRPTLMDKDSFTATYAFDGGRVDSRSTNLLKEYTVAYTGWAMTWESFRVDNASLYLREDAPGICTAEIKMSFAGFGKALLGQAGWYAVESNFSFEKGLLDELDAKSHEAKNEDLKKGIAQISTGEVSSPLPPPHISIISDPTGAEIEIDGEFIGSTPTTITAKAGRAVLRIRKSGFQLWERTITLAAGDRRTINAELLK